MRGAGGRAHAPDAEGGTEEEEEEEEHGLLLVRPAQLEEIAGVNLMSLSALCTLPVPLARARGRGSGRARVAVSV